MRWSAGVRFPLGTDIFRFARASSDVCQVIWLTSTRGYGGWDLKLIFELSVTKLWRRGFIPCLLRSLPCVFASYCLRNCRKWEVLWQLPQTLSRTTTACHLLTIAYNTSFSKFIRTQNFKENSTSLCEIIVYKAYSYLCYAILYVLLQNKKSAVS
jgi:hypothetical protein